MAVKISRLLLLGRPCLPKNFLENLLGMVFHNTISPEGEGVWNVDLELLFQLTKNIKHILQCIQQAASIL